jgi:hypothetical protein
MYGQQVPNVKETKMLGVVIDSKLNWSPHITQKIAYDDPTAPKADMESQTNIHQMVI